VDHLTAIIVKASALFVGDTESKSWSRVLGI